VNESGKVGADYFERYRAAVIRNLEVIGEASHNIAVHLPEFAGSHQDIVVSGVSWQTGAGSCNQALLDCKT